MVDDDIKYDSSIKTLDQLTVPLEPLSKVPVDSVVPPESILVARRMRGQVGGRAGEYIRILRGCAEIEFDRVKPNPPRPRVASPAVSIAVYHSQLRTARVLRGSWGKRPCKQPVQGYSHPCAPGTQVHMHACKRTHHAREARMFRNAYRVAIDDGWGRSWRRSHCWR